MQFLFRQYDELPDCLYGGALTIGNFDGVHRGHRKLIAELRSLATRIDGPSVVFTFWPSPTSILYPERSPPALTTIERRATLLKELGVDYVVACPTNRELLQLSAADFFERIIFSKMKCRAIAEGPNFCFGKDRLGDTQLLAAMCQSRDMLFSVVNAESEDGQMVSSSRVRQALSSGDIAAANAMLTAPYRIQGIVSQGAKRGRELGFPTANLINIPVLVPKHGVYAGRLVSSERSQKVAVHIGPNPTFDDQTPKVEVHILDFTGDIYGQILEIELCARIRDVGRFTSPEALLHQIRQDISQIRQIAC